MTEQAAYTSSKKFAVAIIANSMAFYLISYFVLRLINQFITATASIVYDIPSVMYYNKMQYLTTAETWTFDSIKVIFSAGLIISLIIGLICLVIYLKALELDGLLRLLFLWGFIHALSFFAGSVMVGAFLYEGTGFVLTWMYLTDTVKMLLLFGGLILLILAGALMVKPMLYTANSYYSMLRSDDIPKFKRNQYLYPYFLSSLLLLVIRYPMTLYEILLVFAPGLMLIPTFWGIHFYTDFYFEEQQKKIRPSLKLILTCLLLIAAYRMILTSGVKLG